ncbi:hypothetical protein [Massilia sp. TS11]|uniref:hypothetical protein n=1 Tax=Massilia sp. TS11 TaxID=2908003 RepID=UPI001EDB9A7E|nr:hypothetical protein [Massilia sp. TS11]MCG2585566.1 hypothetical protein [Massilia sp. TS11]
MLTTTLHAWRRAAQWRLLLLWLIALGLPTLLAALPLHAFLAAQFDRSAHVAELAAQLDLVAQTDLRLLFAEQGGATRALGAAGLVLLLICTPFLQAATAAAARLPHAASWAELLAGGARDYLRMARLLLVCLLPAAVLAWLRLALGAAEARALDAAIVPAEVSLHSAAASVLPALAGAVLLLWSESARALLALDRRRRAAPSLWQALRQPWRQQARLAAAYGLCSGLGVLAAAPLLGLRLALPEAGLAGDLAVLALSEAAVLLLVWARCARLFALMGVHAQAPKSA